MKFEMVYSTGSPTWRNTLTSLITRLNDRRIPYDIKVETVEAANRESAHGLPMMRIDADDVERPLARTRRVISP